MSFAQAFALTVSPAVEGGYSYIYNDAGNWTGGQIGSGGFIGTKWGISAPTLNQWLTQRGLATPTQIDMENLSLETAEQIYQAYYWQVIFADKLPANVAGLMFDCAVNQGPGWAPKCLQTAAGATPDGIIGVKTLAAVAKQPPTTLHAEIARIRDERYRINQDWPIFGVGWIRRLMLVVAATANFT